MQLHCPNASEFALTSVTKITAMRVTAVAACWARFKTFGLGIDAAGTTVKAHVCRGLSDGTPGSALTPVVMATLDARATTLLAAFLDRFPVTASTYALGSEVDFFAFHPQFGGISEWRKLQPAETLDLFVWANATNTGKVITMAQVMDR